MLNNMAALVEKSRLADVQVEEDGYLLSSEDDTQSDPSSDADDELAESDNESETESKSATASGITGMANVMAKILSKDVPVNKTAVLAKGQTDREISRKKIQRENSEKGEDVRKRTRKLADTEFQGDSWEIIGHVKPDVLKKDYERNLQRIATRGVVQLFNAVEKQQSLARGPEVKSKVNKSSQPIGSLSKGEFLDLLQGPSVEHTKPKRLKVTEKVEEKKPKWSVLQENFMMGGSMKDWDQLSSDDGND